MDDRIRLAEAMGMVCNCPTIESKYGTTLHNQDCRIGGIYMFNPFTDANDCEALIRFLNDAGWFFQRANEGSNSGKGLILPTITYVRLHRHRPYISHEWRGDDYKQGVCELALKVISDD